MASLLLDIKIGDEVIIPSYTFVSTALAFVRQGAIVRFCDSRKDHPGLDELSIEALINERTKAIVVVHYAGVACDMDIIMNLAKKYGIAVVEDAAQAIDSKYRDTYLGSIGDFGCFSFHETKNIMAGEGGLLTINTQDYCSRAEIIWEKGTNRASFFRGEINKYGWVDIGSSFLPSELTSAFLFAQLENVDAIQARRISIWNRYQENLTTLEQQGEIRLPYIPSYAMNNAHMFYLIMPSLEVRNNFIDYMKSHGILTVFHYLSLHSSQYYGASHDKRDLPMSDFYSDHLVRLPLYYELSNNQVDYICGTIISFFNGK